MITHFGRPGTPGSSRGILPLLAAAAGIGRAVYGAIDANQKKQRTKGYISAAYRSAAGKLALRQQDIRQSSAESLNARGLAQGGEVSGNPSLIRQAMTAGAPGGKPTYRFELGRMVATPGKGATQAAAPIDTQPRATTLGAGVQAETEKEFGTERTDLDEAYKRALNENKADALNAQLGAVSAGINTGMSVYGAGKDLGAMKGAMPGAASATRAAYMNGATGIDDPANVWGGIHPIDPLGAPGSSWNRKRTVLGDGQSNDSFNVGNG